VIGIPSSVAGLADNPDDQIFVEDNGAGHFINAEGLHYKTVDIKSGVVIAQLEYDAERRLNTITDRFNNQVTIERNGDGTPTEIISPDNIRTKLTIDAQNHLTKVIFPDTTSYSFEYSEGSLMTEETDPAANVFTHVFDSTGRVGDIHDQEGGHWSYNFTTDLNENYIIDALTGEGNKTTYTDSVDPAGNYSSTIVDATGGTTYYYRTADEFSVSKTLPCGMDLDFEYGIDPEFQYKFLKKMVKTTPDGLVQTVLADKIYSDTDSDGSADLISDTISRNGNIFTFDNNTLSGQKNLTTPEGRDIGISYDPADLLVETISVPGFFDTTYEYDSRGRATSISTNTRETRFTYDSDGNLNTVTDPQNHMTTYDHDVMGRVTAVHGPDSTALSFSYDNNGNMTVLTNPSEIDHDFGYNKVNLNSSYTPPISGNYSYLYDKDRRLTEITYPSGKQVKYIYDKTRLDRIVTPESSIDYSYLCSSKVGSITDGTNSVAYGYDSTLVTSESLAGTLNQSLTYAYNNDFNVTTFSYAGSSVNYTYDNDGLLTGAGNFTITRNSENGLPQSVSDGNVAVNHTFNGYGEVATQSVNVSSAAPLSWNLTRDNSGRITSKTETVNGVSSTYVYTYDTMGRLLTVTKDLVLVEEYQYSANGTRIHENNTLRSVTRDLTYSDEEHLLTVSNIPTEDTTSYQYEFDGFRLSKTDGSGTTQYTYSTLGELLKVILPDGRVIEYIYDPLQRRVAKKINGAVVEKYLWQGLTRLLAVYDGSDNLVMRFEYADGRTPVAMMAGGSTYYLACDQVGSLRVITDASGSIVKQIDYDSFGNILSENGLLPLTVPFGFAGGLHDRDTGLVKFGYRDYDPDTGRWCAKDPIGFGGGDTDLFGYCLNDPVNLVDPLGLDSATISMVSIFGLHSYPKFEDMDSCPKFQEIPFHRWFIALMDSNGQRVISEMESNYVQQLFKDFNFAATASTTDYAVQIYISIVPDPISNNIHPAVNNSYDAIAGVIQTLVESIPKGVNVRK